MQIINELVGNEIYENKISKPQNIYVGKTKNAQIATTLIENWVVENQF